MGTKRMSVSPGFGYVGNGTTDDTPALAATFAAYGGGCCIEYPQGTTPYIGTKLDIPDGCALVGSHPRLGSVIPADVLNFDPIIVHPDAAITVGNGSVVADAPIVRKDIQFALSSSQVAAQFVGDAIRFRNGSDAIIKDCLLLGFKNLITEEPGVVATWRFRIENVRGDGVNGLMLKGSADKSYLTKFHCWPYLSYNSPAEPNGDHIKRTGIAVNLPNVNDWTEVLDCFNFGYFRGYNIGGVSQVTVIGSGADHASESVPDGSIGFLFEGAARRLQLVGLQAAGKQHGYYFNTDVSGSTAMATNLRAWECDTAGVVINKGHVNISQLSVEKAAKTSATYGVLITGAATGSRVRVRQSEFLNLQYGISGTANANTQQTLNDFVNVTTQTN